MKIQRGVVIAGVLSAVLATVGYCQLPSAPIDWDYMGVRPIRDIAKGEEIKQADVEQIALKKDTEIDIRRDNIKSIMSAVDRHAKRTIKKGELLMYKDFSTQSYGERPKPEFEPTEGCSNFHRYGPQP